MFQSLNQGGCVGGRGKCGCNWVSAQFLVDGVDTPGECIAGFGVGDVSVHISYHLHDNFVDLVHFPPYLRGEGGEISDDG